MASDHDDMKHELRRTRTVGASIDTMRFTIVNRMRAALDADNGRGDLPALRALLADLEDGEGIRGAILHGTSAAKNDDDPEAPVHASNPGSLGDNVYGSRGPADNPRANSMGEPVRGARDLPEDRIANDSQAGTDLPKENLDSAPGAEKYKAEQGDANQTGQQKVNPTGEDKRSDNASFGEHDGEKRREPEPA